ncbi:unnamed protein product [Penicillium salamii]|uniref:Uncharacterized protein n=1 Tax=Penicillium salamii TaxID=1612424 RepID=A0A9W4IWF3_9EURO|nr:unnamed protein product [Penicillium salamii]CAG8356295.1 unnamed protein product [Penicillium salamii]CAG8363909.1 unnamed protein product [Penicillium salamii]
MDAMYADKLHREIAALEEKLDRMVDMLAASERTARERLDGTTASSSPAVEERIIATDLDEEKVLEVFRKQMLLLFPFLMIPSEVTAEELRREKPFLFMNICMVVCQSSVRQREIVKSVQRYVAEHIVMRGEQSLDLLQGLLVNAAWFTSVSRCQPPAASTPTSGHSEIFKAEMEPQSIIRSTSQFDAFVHLLVAQSLSLGLNQELTYQKSLNYPMTYLREALHEPSHNPVRTLEERRTYLGCYYLTTMLSTCVKDLGPIIRFTKYTEECCKVLEQVAENPVDSHLVQLVRVMNLAERIHCTLYRTDLHSSPVSSSPIGLSIRWLEAELRELKARMSGDPSQSAILLTHYDTLEIHLYRVALNQDSAESNYGDHPLMRLDLLYRCLESTTSFFRNFCALPSTFFPYVPFTIICQFGKAIVTLSQLSLYNHSGWDRTYVESTIDFNHTIDQLLAKLEESRPHFQQTLQQDPECTQIPEIYGRMAARGQMLKAMHQRRKDALEQTSPSSMTTMDYELMMNTPLDLLFPFGEIPPVYEPYSFQV